MSADVDSRHELPDTIYSSDAHPLIQTWEEEGSRVMSPKQLSPASWDTFLSNAGYLAGICVDDNSAPRRCQFPVAVPRSGKRPYLQESNEVETETITTQNEREANYVHKGWSLSAISTISPWAQSRVANNNQANRSVPSVTRRLVSHRARVGISLEDISPAPGFEADVQAALQRETRSEKFQALYRAFEHWGDVVGLVLDIGVSFTITDLESRIGNTLDKISSMGSAQYIAQQTAKVSMLGGEPRTVPNGAEKWLYTTVPVGQWSQIRIVKVAPVTTLLPLELQTQLSQLYSSLITYNPPSLGGDIIGGQSFDSSPHLLKTIKSLTVRCSTYVNSLRVTYLDGTYSAGELGGQGIDNTFDLYIGENISEFTVWTEPKGVCALQFVTSAGRKSQCFGGGGSPTIIEGHGGVLAALTGKVKDNIVYNLQGAWRHDIRSTKADREIKYSEYCGGLGGSPFNDMLLLRNSDSLRLSSIRIKCAFLVDGIQLTYDTEQGGQVVRSEGSYYGGPGGGEKTFSLAPSEYIISVTGKIWKGDYISHLCFNTNLGRTSGILGGNEGVPFWSGAPLTSNGRAMRLHSICGRSGNLLNGIVFVWVPV